MAEGQPLQHALIEMGTFLSILTGTIFGGLFILGSGGLHLVSFLIVGIAIAGWWASRYIPPTRPIDPTMPWRLISRRNFLLRNWLPLSL